MIGIDLDNTIVCYDEVFRTIAVEEGLVPSDAAMSKVAIRDHLRSTGREDRWTELQGTIYGPRMNDARPFPGVKEFFAACRAAGMPVAIVSHRTRFPYLGKRHDLHAAARDWLTRNAFHDPDGVALPEDHVFLEETKEAKLARVTALGCTHFVDDLPELLAHPLFPNDVRRILFDPHASSPRPGVVSSWQDLLTLLVGAVERLPGSGNNRVYRIEATAGPVLLKEYFRHVADRRDRLGAELAFSRFAWEHGVRAIPRPLACDRETGKALFEFILGRKLIAGEVTATHVDEAAAFFAAVNRHRQAPEAALLPLASEACFCLAEHLACVETRLARLDRITPESDSHRRAINLVTRRLRPSWERARSIINARVQANGESLTRSLPPYARVISPSDFGFHNCIATASGLTFLDFEYAGWDDPAKTVCDFFCQPAVPVDRSHFERFFTAVAVAVGDESALRSRIAFLFPVYEIKWCCIMLNEFLPAGDYRRTFANAAESSESRRYEQLQKVEAALSRLET